MASIESRPLGQQALRGFGIFQAIVSIPTMIILGFFAWDQMVFAYEENYYYFFASSITALMSAGIVFIVYVQRKAIATPFQAFVFEIVKSVFATGLWLWLILDSAFGPHRGYYTEPEVVRRRVQRDALASLLLLVFFYPPLGYAYVVWRTKSSHGDVERVIGEEEGVDRAERSPLLSRNSGRVLG